MADGRSKRLVLRRCGPSDRIGPVCLWQMCVLLLLWVALQVALLLTQVRFAGLFPPSSRSIDLSPGQ
jgi:hypothetical protein